eukprot:2661022-Pyramimonas_sp.AAC.1
MANVALPRAAATSATVVWGAGLAERHVGMTKPTSQPTSQPANQPTIQPSSSKPANQPTNQAR